MTQKETMMEAARTFAQMDGTTKQNAVAFVMGWAYANGLVSYHKESRTFTETADCEVGSFHEVLDAIYRGEVTG